MSIPKSTPKPEDLTPILLRNAWESGLSERETVTVKLSIFWHKYLLGLGLVVLGALGIYLCLLPLGESHRLLRLAAKLAEALFIAGCLTLSVDGWLKRKLQEDAARDIFQHLMGISLPTELRMKVQRFVEENAIYRKNESIKVHAATKPGGVRLTVEVDATIVAARATDYRPDAEFEQSENPTILEASLRPSPAAKNYYELHDQVIRLSDHPTEPMVTRWSPLDAAVQLDANDELQYYVRYEVDLPSPFFYVIFFGMSSVCPTVRLSASDDLEVFCLRDENTVVNGMEYAHKAVFLRGQHINIRWRPKKAASDVRGNTPAGSVAPPCA